MEEIQETKRDQIANILRKYIPPGFEPSGCGPLFTGQQWYPLPTREQFADTLLSDAEFRSLQLGTWLGTTDGELITEAVSLVISPTYGPEFAVAVEGLKLAAQLQHQKGKESAGKIGLAVLLLATICALGVFSFTREPR